MRAAYARIRHVEPADPQAVDPQPRGRMQALESTMLDTLFARHRAPPHHAGLGRPSALRPVPRIVARAALGSLAAYGAAHLVARFARPSVQPELRTPARRLVDDVAGIHATPARPASADESYYAWKACLGEHADDLPPCDE